MENKTNVYSDELETLAEEINIITSDIKALRNIYKDCDNITILRKKIKELELVIINTDTLLCLSMTPVDREQRAREIGFSIKKNLLQEDINNMQQLENLQYKLQDKEECYLFKRAKL